MSTLYWVADFHFGHEKILEYCDRPFKNADEMDEALITNYNKIVTDKDTVYFLGDISFHKDFKKTKSIIKKLKGRKYLIYGNHDKRYREEYKELFIECHDYLEINYNKTKICMMHYPIESFNKMRHGSWMLSGHSHSTIDDRNDELIKNKIYRYDCGVDGNDFKPISFDQLKMKFYREDKSKSAV